MNPVRQTQKKYASRAMTAAIVIGLVFILAGQKPLGKGFVLGTVFSVINFILMGEILPMKMSKSRGKTFFFSLFSMVFRYALMAVPLIVAMKFEQFNVVAAIVGIFMIQMVILGDHVLNLIWPKKQQRT